ncbi:MAG: universal stress protein [Thermodesulfovibrionales bacterium]|nr:universal stress protein [Thermodesulfovibrionales bacterium]
MYSRILATVNEHLTSEIAGLYSLHIAKACNAVLYLAYIAEKGTIESDLKKAESALKKLFYNAEKSGLKVEAIFDTGNFKQKIKEIAETKKIDIIFAATSRSGKTEYGLGSSAKALLRLPLSVCLVRVVHFGKIHPGRILIPLKSKIDHIEERAYFSALLAKAFGSSIHLFHITRPSTGFFHGEIHLTAFELEKRLSRDMLSFIDKLQELGVNFERKLSHGAPSKDITIEAASRRFDLIMMGASTRSFIGSLIEKSPLEYVIEKTPCNLLIFKPKR